MTSPSKKGSKSPVQTRAQRIAELNDNFRSTKSRKNTYVTLDLVDRGTPFLKKVISGVRDWVNPIDENDTDTERSWGYILADGSRIQWSIDYYSLDGESDSPDPANGALTLRTLTLEQS